MRGRSQLLSIRLALVVQALLLLALGAAMVSSCSKQPERTGPAVTARVLTPADLQLQLGGTLCGDSAYAEVSSASLRPYYDEFRQALFDQGVTKWDVRFDCNHFASYYVARAQAQFYLANFHKRTPAQTLALGVIWYRPDSQLSALNSQPRSGHAIVAAFTERGLLFIEPQTGGELQLSPNERANAWLKLF